MNSDTPDSSAPDTGTPAGPPRMSKLAIASLVLLPLPMILMVAGGILCNYFSESWSWIAILGILIGIVSLPTGIIVAIRSLFVIRRSRGRMNGMWIAGSCILLRVVMMTLGVMSFLNARENSRRNACIGNMCQIDSAKEQWAMANNKSDGAIVTMEDLVGPDKYMRNTPVCPSGGRYTVNPVGTCPICTKHGDILTQARGK